MGGGSTWKTFSITYNFPDGGYWQGSPATKVNTGTLFTTEKDLYINSITCVGYNNNEMGTYYPLTYYWYSAYAGDYEYDAPIIPMLILNGVVQMSWLGNLTRDSAYNKSAKPQLEWVVDGNSVSMNRIDSISTYGTTNWGLAAVTLKGFIRN